MGWCRRDEFADEIRMLARWDHDVEFEFTDATLEVLRQLVDASGRVTIALGPDVDLAIWAITNPDHPGDYDVALADA